MRAPRRHSDQIHLLVAPVKWTTTVAVKNLFEEENLPVRVVGASTTDAALKQLTKNTHYQAVLIDWAEAGASGLELACAIKELGRPLVVAFQDHWSRDDVRRALQLGVDCLLLKPLSPDELFADLSALQEGQTSRSRLSPSGISRTRGPPWSLSVDALIASIWRAPAGAAREI